MSIRKSLERRVESSDVELGMTHPDRIYVRNEELAELCSDQIVSKGRRKYIPLNHIWRAAPQLNSWNWEDSRPEWLDAAISESRWAYDNFWDAKSGVAWYLEDRLIINSPFTLTLSDRITSLTSSSTKFSNDLRSWISIKPALDDGTLSEVITEYGILPSPQLSSVMEGRENWKKYLDIHAMKSEEAGYRIPDTFPTPRTLKDHQKTGVMALVGLRNTILADQVGLGKGGEFTSGFLSIIQKQMEDGATPSEVFPLVMVTTNSMKEEIAAEVLKWKEDAVIEVLYGTSSQPIDIKTQFIVLNVDLLSKRLPDILEAHPKGMVVDEAHTLKNPDAKRTIAAQELSDYLRENIEDPYIVLASGTPFLNQPYELWSLMCILGIQHIFAEYAFTKIGARKQKVHTRNGWKWLDISDERAFQTRWCDGQYGGYKDKEWLFGGVSNSAELNRLLLEFGMVRRRKSDVMVPMPKLEEQLIMVPITGDERDEYDRIDAEFAEWMKERAREEAEEQGISVREALRIVYYKLANAEAVMRMTALRQAAARGKIHPLVEWIHGFMDGSLEYIAQTGETIRVGDDPDRKKLIVFAYHREIQQILIEHPDLQQYGLVAIQSGGEDTQEVKRMFQRDERVRLIICYSGAREGHTLTAAKDVLLAEIPFVPSWVVQMAGRCWARLSEEYEPHEATVWYGVAEDSVDSYLINKVRTKKQMFSAVIDGEGLEELTTSDSGSQEESDTLIEMIVAGRKKINIAG